MFFANEIQEIKLSLLKAITWNGVTYSQIYRQPYRSMTNMSPHKIQNYVSELKN